jgi:hypothetical protein
MPDTTYPLWWAGYPDNVALLQWSPVILLLQRKQLVEKRRLVLSFWLLGNPGGLEVVRHRPSEVLVSIQHPSLSLRLTMKTGRSGANDWNCHHLGGWCCFLCSQFPVHDQRREGEMIAEPNETAWYTLCAWLEFYTDYLNVFKRFFHD